jgi:hypothetical protein
MYHTFLHVWSADKLAFPLWWESFSTGSEEPEEPPEPVVSLWNRLGSAGSADLFHAKMRVGEVTPIYKGGDLPSSYQVKLQGYLPRDYGVNYEVHGNQLWYTTRDSWHNVNVFCYFTRHIDTTAPWDVYYRSHRNQFPMYRHEAYLLFRREFNDREYKALQGNVKALAEAAGFWRTGSTYTHTTYVYSGDIEYYVPPAELPSFSFKHNEFDAYIGWEDLGLLPNLYRNGWACAFTEAAKRLPFASTNSLANFVEIATAIISISKGLKAVTHTAKLARAWSAKTGVRLGISDFKNPFNVRFKTPRELWLAYRYSYTTTKADAKEYLSLINRLTTLPGKQHCLVGGTFVREDMYFRCTAEFAVEDVLPDSVYEMIGTMNAELSARNVWDLIPFSFVVDWFIGIGDALERFDLYNLVQRIVPTEVWFSYHSSYPNNEGIQQDIYFRVNGSGLKLGNPWWSDQKSSVRTKLFRIVDSLALFGAN